MVAKEIIAYRQPLATVEPTRFSAYQAHRIYIAYLFFVMSFCCIPLYVPAMLTIILPL
jgi:hypothetical protein